MAELPEDAAQQGKQDEDRENTLSEKFLQYHLPPSLVTAFEGDHLTWDALVLINVDKDLDELCKQYSINIVDKLKLKKCLLDAQKEQVRRNQNDENDYCKRDERKQNNKEDTACISSEFARLWKDFVLPKDDPRLLDPRTNRTREFMQMCVSLLGASFVGKTCLYHRILFDIQAEPMPTISADFRSVHIDTGTYTVQ